MISRDDNNMPTGRGGHPAQEPVIELLGTIARSAGVKDITRYQQRVDFILLNRLRQPGQKSLELLVAFSAIKSAPNVPVGCVENSHTVTQPPQRRGASRILHASFLMNSCRPEDRLASAAPLVTLLAASVQTRSIWS